jgi:hypothetical protein
MSLYWPDSENDIDVTKPRLHAFIIGVGDYPHLMGGAGNAAVANFNLPQLTTTVHTAMRIAEWLCTEYANPAVPLGSIELLLSPAQAVTRPDGKQVPIDAASMANVRKVFEDQWYPRCHAQQGNIAFSYFAGHGISTASQYLLLSDFGNPAKPNLWANCIDFDGMRVGMRANHADHQLFFVDACREKPIDALVQLNPNGEPLCTASIFDQVASVGVYHAAADGQQAYGPPNGITFFATALLDSLQGAGALHKKGQWFVDTFQLGAGLGHVMKDLAAQHNQPLSCNPSSSGIPVILHVPQSPKIRASVVCPNPQASAESEIVVLQGGATVQSKKGDDRPWRGHLAPGDVDVTVSFQSFPNQNVHDRVQPPLYELEVTV